MGDVNFAARLVQFLRVVGHLIEDVEPANFGKQDLDVQKNLKGTRQGSCRRGDHPPLQEPESARGAALTMEERAIMAACDADESWRALRALSPEGRDKLLCTGGGGGQWPEPKIPIVAKRWGADELDACGLHREVFQVLERHVMGITAAQFVWSPVEDDTDVADMEAVPSGETEMDCPLDEGGEDSAPKRRRPGKSDPSDDDDQRGDNHK